MAISAKQSQSGKAGVNWRRGFAELSFIPVASDWIELLASRLAQPLMFVSSLYIIAETTIPGVAAWSAWLDLSTRTVMSLAPEIILPGCFLQSQQSQRDGKERKAKLLLTLFGFCIFLLAITLASFIWHFSDAINGLILFVRCGVGVTYTVILKIDKESAVVIAQPTQLTAQPLPTHEDLAQLIAQSVESAVSPLRNELRSVQLFVQKTAQWPVEVEEIAQDPEPLELGPEQTVRRPRIAQRSTMRTDHEEAAQSEVVRTDHEEDCAAEDDDAQDEETDVVPIAQQETNVMPAVRTAQPGQKDVRTRVYEFLDAHYATNGPTARITNLEIEKGAPASKNKVVEYRREYDREKRGGV